MHLVYQMHIILCLFLLEVLLIPADGIGPSLSTQAFITSSVALILASLIFVQLI